jgi:hypothetical protein
LNRRPSRTKYYTYSLRSPTARGRVAMRKVGKLMPTVRPTSSCAFIRPTRASWAWCRRGAIGLRGLDRTLFVAVSGGCPAALPREDDMRRSLALPRPEAPPVSALYRPPQERRPRRDAVTVLSGKFRPVWTPLSFPPGTRIRPRAGQRARIGQPAERFCGVSRTRPPKIVLRGPDALCIASFPGRYIVLSGKSRSRPYRLSREPLPSSRGRIVVRPGN